MTSVLEKYEEEEEEEEPKYCKKASFLVYFEIYRICRIQQHLCCGRDNESAHNSQCMKPEKSIII